MPIQLVGQELLEADNVAVAAVGAVYLAVDGEEDGVVETAGVCGLMDLPVAAAPADVAAVEELGAAAGGTGDVACVVVPVVGPAVDISLGAWHGGVEGRGDGLGDGD